ncbi:MAG: helix-turn-helix transcriptional regulator [Treponema sp.]|nr:helix-turn-helix transcriptional regulator [Treponema sp.]
MNETLRALREQNNYSQAAVASYLNISRQMYIKYENGDAVPPVKTVVELSNFYRVPYDVILEDKLNHSERQKQQEKSEDGVYTIPEETELELHDSNAVFATMNNPSYYLTSILEMLPKLVYKEQLKVLEKVSGLVQKATEEKLKPNKQSDFYVELNKLNSKYHPTSNGKGWTREELYER